MVAPLCADSDHVGIQVFLGFLIILHLPLTTLPPRLVVTHVGIR